MSGFLKVITTGTIHKQIWYRTDSTNDFETYVRTKSEIWSEWQQYLTKNELENKATKYVQLYGEISSKDIFILSDNVNNYDEIHVFATANKWGHRVTGTIFKYNLSSDMLQIFPFNKNYWEESIKIYETTVDTTSADLIGTEDYRILGIYGVKY